MPDLFDYINAAMQKTQCSSYARLAEKLGVGRNVITTYKRGVLPTDKTMIQIAELAGRDKWQALIDLNIWRTANDPETQKVWKNLLSTLPKTVLGILTFFIICDAHPSQATVKNGLKVSSDKCVSVYYVK